MASNYTLPRPPVRSCVGPNATFDIPHSAVDGTRRRFYNFRAGPFIGSWPAHFSTCSPAASGNLGALFNKGSMRRFLTAAVVAACLVSPRLVAAQVSSTAPPSFDQRSFLMGIGGAGSVHSAAALAGGELGYRPTQRVEIFGQAIGMQNVATKQQIAHASQIGAVLHASQGGTVTSSIDAPAWYVGGGLRVLLASEGRRVRPFLVAGVGVARVTLQPSLTLGGADVTDSLPQYGVTLGSDLTGTATEPALDGGGGLRFAFGRQWLDGDVRVITIRTSGQATNVLRTSVSYGFAF